jgi:hypothetical protein
MRDSIRLGIMFNIIDGSQGVKADLVPSNRSLAIGPIYWMKPDQSARGGTISTKVCPRSTT